MDNTDTYMSVFEALKAAAWHNDAKIDIKWIDASKYDDAHADITPVLRDFDGIVVPGGFGQRGLEGKIKAAQYALKTKMPYLGLCLGLQMAVIAAARNAGITDATTFELEPDSNNVVINTMADQDDKCKPVAPCAWATTTAYWKKAAWQPKSTAAPRLSNAIATAANATTTTATNTRLGVSKPVVLIRKIT